VVVELRHAPPRRLYLRRLVREQVLLRLARARRQEEVQYQRP
jgi:hypothetical protein